MTGRISREGKVAVVTGAGAVGAGAHPGATGRHRATAVTGQTDTTHETRHQHNQ